MQRRELLVGMIGVAVIPGCTDETSESTAENSDNSATQTSAANNTPSSISKIVAFEDVSWNPEQNTPAVTGLVTNTGSQSIDFLTIVVEYFDEQGVRIGDGATNVEALKPDVTAEFEIFFYGDDATRVDDYEIFVDEEKSWFN